MQSPWYKQPFTIVISASLFMIAVGSFTTFLIIKNNDQLISKSSSSNQNSSSPENSQSKILALQRFNQITKNISPQEFDQLAQTSTTEQQKLTGNNDRATSQSNSNMFDSRIGAINSYATELFQEKQLVDDTIFYNETETIYNTPSFESQDSALDKSDRNSSWNTQNANKSTVQNTKTWYSLNNYKSVVSENGKIVSIYITTPTSSLTYLGGKYAIRDNFNEANYLSGVYFGGIANQELAFLKQLLQDPNMKKTGAVVLDGKNLDVYEQSYDYRTQGSTNPAPPIASSSVSPDETYLEQQTSKISSELSNINQENVTSSSYSGDQIYCDKDCLDISSLTKYYIDTSNFSLYLMENYNGKILASSVKTIQSQEIKNPDFSLFSKVLEDSQVPIKDFQTNEIYENTSKLEGFVEKYGIFYDPKLTTSNITANDSDSQASKEYSRVRNTLDFDPNYIDYAQQSTEQPLGYAGQSDKNVYMSFSYFKEKPPFTSIVIGEYDKTNIKETTVTINNQKVAAQTISDTNTSSQYTLFFYNQYWIMVNIYQYTGYEVPANRQLNDLNLVFLSVDQAKNIDTYRSQKAKNIVTLEPTTLDKLESKTRLLLGDLSSQGLQLATVLTPVKTPTKCLDFIDYEYEIDTCLVSHFNGFSLNYYTNTYSISPANSGEKAVDLSMPSEQATSSVIASILPVQIDQKQIEGIVNKINQSGNGSELVITKQNFGYSITPKQAGYNNYFIFSKNSQTVIVNISQYNTGGDIDSQSNIKIISLANQIVSQTAIDKDLEILKKQLEQSIDSNTTITTKN